MPGDRGYGGRRQVRLFSGCLTPQSWPLSACPLTAFVVIYQIYWPWFGSAFFGSYWYDRIFPSSDTLTQRR